MLPVVLRRGESFDAALARSEHRSIVDVLGALRSHDEDIIKSLDGLRFSTAPDPGQSLLPGRFVVDAPLEVGENFAAAVDVALTGALGASTERSSRGSGLPVPPLLPPREAKPRTDEELFEIGLRRIAAMGRWQLQPRVPDEDADGFPLASCWQEIKGRWAAGSLSAVDRQEIANSISWLARDLAEAPAVQAEMARMSNADVPEQLACQCREDGAYARLLEPLTEINADALIEPFSQLQDLITHAAMPPQQRVRYLVAAALRLAAAVGEAGEASNLGWWERQPWQTAAIDGFIYELQLAREGAASVDPPSEPWNAAVLPIAHLLGRRGAEPFAAFARRMSIYSFPGAADAVESRREDETQLAATHRLDPLGWEIYLLARKRGDYEHDALRLAGEGSRAGRLRVREDLRRRSIRELES